MKWISGHTILEKIEQKKQWHRWFAWHPVVIGINEDNREVKVWLEYVLRKGEPRFLEPKAEGILSYDWTYKEMEKENNEKH